MTVTTYPTAWAAVADHVSACGVETVFGSMYPEDLGISLEPKLSAEHAVARVSAIAGHVHPNLAALRGDGEVNGVVRRGVRCRDAESR